MGTGPHALNDAARLSLGRTLRRGIRAWWDHLGLACALSALWTIAVGIPTGLALQYATAARGIVLALGLPVALAIAAWVTAGIHRSAFQAIEGDEPGIAWVWRTDAALMRQALGLAFIQWVVTLGLALNIAFYLSLRSPLGLVLAVVFGYGMVFWLSACQYQWPLLTAGAMGLISRDDGSRPRLASVFRNAFILALGSPLYSLALGCIMLGLAVPLVVTGVGLVLVAPGLIAFLTSQSVRDHMVRFGMVAPPDEGGPVPDVWTVPKNET
ncbi:MAG: hypothetical protein GX446_06435 [Chthonomonadales bacterium]|nr:hypothetical protein [Chthonomonadales bacterium]